jgi:hypothetical protein
LTLRESGSVVLILPVGAAGGVNGFGRRPNFLPFLSTPRAR